MFVYVVVNDYNAQYDHGNQYEGVFATMEQAEEYVSRFGERNAWMFDIIVEEI